MKKTPISGDKMDGIDLADDFRAVYGRGARKRLAREARVSSETVKSWFAGKWPKARNREFGELLIAHIERQQRMLGEIKDRARLLAQRGIE